MHTKWHIATANRQTATSVYATRYDDGELKGYYAVATDALGRTVREGVAFTKSEVYTIARTLGVEKSRVNVERRTR